MMSTYTKIELFKEDMKFSAGHFTIFSNTERENLHGHNYRLHASILAKINEDGMAIDYRLYKKKLRSICKTLDEIVIIPGLCKHLTITEIHSYLQIIFNSETMFFLKRDVIVLPISNVTVEELANWFIRQITKDESELEQNNIIAIKIKIFSSPGQSASANWKKIGNQMHE